MVQLGQTWIGLRHPTCQYLAGNLAIFDLTPLNPQSSIYDPWGLLRRYANLFMSSMRSSDQGFLLQQDPCLTAALETIAEFRYDICANLLDWNKQTTCHRLRLQLRISTIQGG